jgi:hypothetical protein
MPAVQPKDGQVGDPVPARQPTPTGRPSRAAQGQPAAARRRPQGRQHRRHPTGPHTDQSTAAAPVARRSRRYRWTPTPVTPGGAAALRGDGSAAVPGSTAASGQLGYFRIARIRQSGPGLSHLVRSGNAASVRVGARALRNAEVSGAGLLARWRLAPPGRGVRLATHSRCPLA